MTKLLDLTIKISNGGYKDSNSLVVRGSPHARLIKVAGGEIKDQEGQIYSELKLKRGNRVSNFPISNIKNIELNFQVLDIPISWAWKTKGSNTQIEFKLKKIKYDEEQGLRFGSHGLVSFRAVADTLFLGFDDFEGLEVFKSKTDKILSLYIRSYKE